MAIIGTKCAGLLLDSGFSFGVVVDVLVSELQLTKDEAVRGDGQRRTPSGASVATTVRKEALVESARRRTVRRDMKNGTGTLFLSAHVHQAAGIVSVQAHCEIPEALARLRTKADETGHSIEEVALDVLDHLVRFD